MTIQLVPTEIELTSLAERIRTVKAALAEAVQLKRQAEKNLVVADNNVRELRAQFSAARGALVAAAGGDDEIGLTWLV